MKAWFNLLKQIEKKVGIFSANKWLYSLKIIKFDACNLYLQAENYFQAQWFEEYVKPFLKKGFYNENFHPIKVHLTIANDIIKQKSISYIREFKIESTPLNDYFKFHFFIVSEKNLMPIKILNESSSSMHQFTPIYLYGPKKSGKTHLLQACAHKLTERNLKVFYISAKTFTSHVVESIRLSKMNELRNIYRNLDVLIVDDVEIFGKKISTQEEFFHTFNALQTMGKLIILSSQAAPNELTDVEPRLVSRFEWGIILEIEKIEDLSLILKNQMEILNLKLTKEIQTYLLNTFKNIESLKKALKLIALNMHIENKENLTIEKVKIFLNTLIIEENEKKITPEKILYAASAYFGITQNDILGKAQTRECTLPRQFSMYLCREILNMPFMKIGSYFKRDHSTVMTSVKSIKGLLESNNNEAFSAFKEITKTLEN